MTTGETAGVNDATHGHEGSAMTGNPCPEPIPAPAALIFTVYGRPVTQGSIRSLGKGRPSVHGNAATLKPWRHNVYITALGARYQRERDLGPVAVDLLFCFDRPSSHMKITRDSISLRTNAPAEPITRSSGDLDKLTRAILDALTDAGVFKDDSQVVDLRARKTWTGHDELLIPGVRITVREVTP